jgi:hypothetical protein
MAVEKMSVDKIVAYEMAHCHFLYIIEEFGYQLEFFVAKLLEPSVCQSFKTFFSPMTFKK